MTGERIGTQMQPAAEPFIARSAPMLRVAEALERAARTDVCVLLYGEAGVGKSHAARQVHCLSRRRQDPLRVFSVRDAGAAGRLADPGFRAAVRGGTLLIEGVHEAPAATQTALVGAIEEWTTQEEGADEVPVRLVVTSERDLTLAVEAGEFRNDLFYLLEVFPVLVPPLRERTEEIPALIEWFARRHMPQNSDAIAIPLSFLQEAVGYRWPGNLRELENTVIRACPDDDGDGWRFPPSLHLRGSCAGVVPFQQAKRDFEESYVNRLLLATAGNVTRSAELAGKARKDFYALMARNNIDPARFRAGAKD